MPDINRSQVVPYSQEQMYKLVNDIESYCEFIPWCVSSRIDSCAPDEIRATLAFSRGGLYKAFTTLNRLQPQKMIEIRLVNGSFKHLEGFWRFEEVENGHCRVLLDLKFEFNSRLVSMMFGPIFHQIANTLVDAFCSRAEVVYGQKS